MGGEPSLEPHEKRKPWALDQIASGYLTPLAKGFCLFHPDLYTSGMPPKDSNSHTLLMLLSIQKWTLHTLDTLQSCGRMDRRKEISRPSFIPSLLLSLLHASPLHLHFIVGTPRLTEGPELWACAFSWVPPFLHPGCHQKAFKASTCLVMQLQKPSPAILPAEQLQSPLRESTASCSCYCSPSHPEAKFPTFDRARTTPQLLLIAFSNLNLPPPSTSQLNPFPADQTYKQTY